MDDGPDVLLFTDWVQKNYGSNSRTKTINRDKYRRICSYLRGEDPEVNAKFRYWVKSKGFRLLRHDHVTNDVHDDINGELYVSLYAKEEPVGTIGGSIEKFLRTNLPAISFYRRIAVVDDFRDIIRTVHVDEKGRHAGQKKTFRLVSDTYAFLPREVITFYLLNCEICKPRIQKYRPVQPKSSLTNDKTQTRHDGETTDNGDNILTNTDTFQEKKSTKSDTKNEFIPDKKRIDVIEKEIELLQPEFYRSINDVTTNNSYKHHYKELPVHSLRVDNDYSEDEQSLRRPKHRKYDGMSKILQTTEKEVDLTSSEDPKNLQPRNKLPKTGWYYPQTAEMPLLRRKGFPMENRRFLGMETLYKENPRARREYLMFEPMYEENPHMRADYHSLEYDIHAKSFQIPGSYYHRYCCDYSRPPMLMPYHLHPPAIRAVSYDDIQQNVNRQKGRLLREDEGFSRKKRKGKERCHFKRGLSYMK